VNVADAARGIDLKFVFTSDPENLAVPSNKFGFCPVDCIIRED
jgi:hypothetical protein